MDPTTGILFLSASYLIGAIPFGLLTVRLVKGVDIREVGSGNIGATNVGRILGKKGFVAVFLMDLCKGLGPVLAASWYVHRSGHGASARNPWVIGCGLAAILGHVFPVYLKFKGGKAVATSTGAFAALAPWATLIGFAAFLLMFGLFRYVSLASTTAAVAVVAGVLATTDDPFGADKPLSIMAFIIGALIILRHKENIRRLVRGEENPFGKTRDEEEPAEPAQAEEGKEGEEAEQ